NCWSALHWAAYFGYEPLVTLLLENNADCSKVTQNGLEGDDTFKGKTAREIAKLRHHKVCARIIMFHLLKKGVSVGFQTSSTVLQVIPSI
ncbi:hypothetical protein U3516DRAFT_545558, partial [Neocallimastix sp. 'constans']